MIKFLIFLLSVFFVGCKGPDKNITIESESRAIIGITPSSNLQCLSVDDDYAEFYFISSHESTLSWIYYWPVSREHFEFIDFKSFYEKSISLIHLKGSVIIFVGQIEYSVDGLIQEYEIELTLSWISKEKVKCDIKVVKKAKGEK